ncbi:adenylate/guanylate cyclase domain-containing protein [Roseibium sp. Sym1]|uniref:adenylate/guanylate cyclase domain-containing protein n=1 Tax=Roseibium sp. Sym1 TaxID=3016006 RepID=UPI0022B55A68|nr:adenylate/guanylate cyclase domain-containing protein [Roseibium sp. Sym1]
MRPGRTRFPITVSLFVVTLGVALALAATIISYTHYSNRASALTAGRALMERSAEVVRLQTASLIAPIDSIADYSGDWLDVDAVPKASGHPARKRMISFVNVMPQIANIYIGYHDGSSYLIGAARTRSKKDLEALGAPEGTHLLEQIILRGDRSKPIRYDRFLDENGDTLATTSTYEIDYDPRERPWFKAADEVAHVTRTDVYLFAGTGEPGLTVSKRYAKGVVGVDLTLEDLDNFLNSEPQAKEGVLAIIGRDGALLANSSENETVDRSGWRAALEALQTRVLDPGQDTVDTIDVNGRMWITHLSKIELGANTQENLAIALPLSAVVGELTQASRRTIGVSMLIALGSVPLIWLVSRSLSRPLQVLADGTRRIREFDLDQPFPHESVVDEIYKLEGALDQMRTSLQTFGRYVPKALVRRMIERQEVPEPGGVKRDITVLFMDLENFTAMSSHLEPEEVMRRMSRYFEIVTQTLLDHDATIDKYIGDAVMAFWNAPNRVEDHAAKACEAALAVIAASKAETDSWQDGDIPPVRTRIGLHTGEAIVGNVGSSDRLNYTALGDTVNLASRLEGVNRELKTSILVSENLAARVEGRFQMRSVGETAVKGYEAPVKVFELLPEE